jgi:hypothetical protein
MTRLKKVRRLLSSIGPGFITGASDDDPLTIWTGFLAIGGILPIIVILLLALWQKNALFNSKGMLTLLGGTLCAFGFAILGSCSAIIALLIAPVNIKKYI